MANSRATGCIVEINGAVTYIKKDEEDGARCGFSALNLDDFTVLVYDWELDGSKGGQPVHVHVHNTTLDLVTSPTCIFPEGEGMFGVREEEGRVGRVFDLVSFLSPQFPYMHNPFVSLSFITYRSSHPPSSGE